MNDLQVFCRQVRARSAEHRRALGALRELPGQVVATLRQELDSLVRVIFLLAQRDRDYRDQLISAAVSGEKWTVNGSPQRVTDRAMVDLAQNFHGWTKSVYEFGCAFIHLSNLHDYRSRDPLQQIRTAEREAIINHLRYYHGGPSQTTPTFDDVVPFLPAVFAKIADNLESYVRQLERGEDLER